MKRNPYAELGLSTEAPLEVVKAAYRALAKKYHPDKWDDQAAGEQKLKDINHAYEQILTAISDGEKSIYPQAENHSPTGTSNHSENRDEDVTNSKNSEQRTHPQPTNSQSFHDRFNEFRHSTLGSCAGVLGFFFLLSCLIGWLVDGVGVDINILAVPIGLIALAALVYSHCR